MDTKWKRLYNSPQENYEFISQDICIKCMHIRKKYKMRMSLGVISKSKRIRE